MNIIKRLNPIARLSFLVMAVGIPSLHASIALQHYEFTGQCSDCNGTVAAQLTLAADYTQGAAITLANFISLTYDGSNLLAPFTIDQSNVTSVSGSIPTDLPAFATVDINGPGTENFFSFAGAPGNPGSWVVDLSEDMGTNGIWTSTATTVPEPASLVETGFGLVLAFLAIKRQRCSQLS